MNLLKTLQNRNQECHSISTDCMQNIMRYCNEHEDTANFVKFVIGNFKERSVEKLIQSELTMFAYKLGYNIQFNRYSTPDFICQLDSFIANYFYDDSEAIFYKKEYANTGIFIWKAKVSEYEDTAATPKDFIDKATDNIRSYSEIDKIIKSRKKLIKKE